MNTWDAGEDADSGRQGVPGEEMLLLSGRSRLLCYEYPGLVSKLFKELLNTTYHKKTPGENRVSYDLNCGTAVSFEIAFSSRETCLEIKHI